MKKRKAYSDEFKAEAVTMVTEQGRFISDVCQALSVGQTALTSLSDSAVLTRQTPGGLAT